MNTIEIQNLTKDYGKGRGIFDISFSVRKGEAVGFLGANGAGKTTTMRHLMGFIRPKYGTVKILNLDCFSQAAQVQEQIGYLPGEIAFMDNMTGYGFIQFMAQMKHIRDMSRARELIEYLELDPYTKIRKMSKGMKQKVALVIAFMQDSPILLLDEPTSGLDPLMQNRFVELINKEKQEGKTILMSSHIFEEVEHTCDRIVMIKNGRLIADKNMDTIRAGLSKRYEITFRDSESATAFSRLYPEGTLAENTFCFLSKEDPHKLLRQLCQYHITDINARPQTLEEIFMQYYGGGKL